jgi:hypothetical protein
VSAQVVLDADAAEPDLSGTEADRESEVVGVAVKPVDGRTENRWCLLDGEEAILGLALPDFECDQLCERLNTLRECGEDLLPRYVRTSVRRSRMLTTW